VNSMTYESLFFLVLNWCSQVATIRPLYNADLIVGRALILLF
jgi:hypothetical protein